MIPPLLLHLPHDTRAGPGAVVSFLGGAGVAAAEVQGDGVVGELTLLLLNPLPHFLSPHLHPAPVVPDTCLVEVVQLHKIKCLTGAMDLILRAKLSHGWQEVQLVSLGLKKQSALG